MLFSTDALGFGWAVTTHQIVRTEHLNQYGLLFGGQMLAWVDEAAGIAARLDYPSGEFVTAGMDEVAFRRGVALGSVLAFEVDRLRSGHTSVGYRVTVRIASAPTAAQHENSARMGEIAFGTTVTVVHIGPDGNKLALPQQS